MTSGVTPRSKFSQRVALAGDRDGPANPVLIRPIPQLAEARCAPSYAVADLDLPRLRLDPPRLRLWLNGQEIHFGDTAPTAAGWWAYGCSASPLLKLEKTREHGVFAIE